jgi:TolB protein
MINKKIFVILYISIFFASLSAQLRIEIKGGLQDPIVVAVVPMKWNLDSPQELFIHEVIKSDLESFGEFKVLPPNNMLSLPASKEQVFYKDWRLLGTDYLVIGNVQPTNTDKEIEVKYFIFDVTREKTIHSGVVLGPKKTLRSIGHKISDNIYDRIQGLPGIFSTKLAYIDKPSLLDPYYNLMISDLDGHESLALYSSPEPLMSPSWSPDMKRIAYVSFEDGSSRIYIQNLSNAQRIGLKLEKGINSSPNWSPNGKKLSAVLSKMGNPDIFIYDLGTSQWSQVTEHFGIDTEPDWSPNSRKVLFTSNRSGSPQIYEADTRTNKIKRLTFEGTYNARGRYLPNGKAMVFVHRIDGVFHIATQNLRTGKIRILTDTTLDESPTVSPNGNVVIYATKDGDKDILAGITIDGKTKFTMSSLKGEAREPSWSPLID